MTSLRDLAELVRAPAALTVPGDTLAGAACVSGLRRGRVLLMPLASVSLYWAGMALNDFADRERDSQERPERPIPSGRVSPRTALLVASALTATGVAVAAVAGGRRSASVAGALAVAVWAYDLSAKSGPASVATMAATRGLDVLLGASAGGPGSLGRAIAPAALLAAHTASVTALSRGEVHGSRPATARAAVSATGLVGVLAPLAPLLGPTRPAPTRWVPAPRTHAVASALFAAAYLARVGGAQWAAARRPDGPTVRTATGAGIHGMVPLQAALLAGRGAPVGALVLMASQVAARSLLKRSSPT